MIVLLSYVIAVVLTLFLAVMLYPIAAMFWLGEVIGKVLVAILNFFGKISDNMFKFTTKLIRHLWRDISNLDKQSVPAISTAEQWTCTCGTLNTGKFCSQCGGAKPQPETEEN